MVPVRRRRAVRIGRAGRGGLIFDRWMRKFPETPVVPTYSSLYPDMEMRE
jgi:hypothetical protein